MYSPLSYYRPGGATPRTFLQGGWKSNRREPRVSVIVVATGSIISAPAIQNGSVYTPTLSQVVAPGLINDGSLYSPSALLQSVFPPFINNGVVHTPDLGPGLAVDPTFINDGFVSTPSVQYILQQAGFINDGFVYIPSAQQTVAPTFINDGAIYDPTTGVSTVAVSAPEDSVLFFPKRWNRKSLVGKDPDETVRLFFEFSKDLGTDETITLLDAYGGGLTLSVAVSFGSQIQVLASGGAEGTTYKTWARVQTSKGQILEAAGSVVVESA